MYNRASRREGLSAACVRALVCLVFGFAPIAWAAALPPEVQQVSAVNIDDPNGFARPMTAMRVLIPAGWRAEGSVVWNPLGTCGPDYALNWRAVSADGSKSLSFVPVPNWTGMRSAYPTGQPNPCGEAFYTSAREFLEATARRMFPSARLLDYRASPEEAKPIRDSINGLVPLAVPNFESRMAVDAGELLIGYEEDGRDMRAVLSSLVVIGFTSVGDVMNPGQLAWEGVSGYPSNVTINRAPNGELDMGLRTRINKSMLATPEWFREMQAYRQRKFEISRPQPGPSPGRGPDNAAHEARMDAIRTTGDIINGLYDSNDASSDRSQRERIEAIRGVETYRDPVAGQPVQLDNTYQHAWRVSNQDNTYIMTNDPNFNPGLYDIEAQQLQVLP